VRGEGVAVACATDLDAIVDASFDVGSVSHRLTAVVAQRETITEDGHDCGGIQGCDH
jgi:hypothetical protein